MKLHELKKYKSRSNAQALVCTCTKTAVRFLTLHCRNETPTIDDYVLCNLTNLIFFSGILMPPKINLFKMQDPSPD